MNTSQTYPSVDQERQGRDIRPSQSSLQRRDISNDDFNQKSDDCVADLVKDGTSCESRDIVSSSLNDGTKEVEEDGEVDKLNTTKDVGNLCSCRLSSSSDDSANNVDSREQRVLADRRQGSALTVLAS